jgi:hypothetical protein
VYSALQGRLRRDGVIVELRSWQLAVEEIAKSSAWAAVTRAGESEESPLSEAVARERPVKTQLAGKA